MITHVIANSKELMHVDEYEIPENQENRENKENKENQENQENQKINIIEL